MRPCTAIDLENTAFNKYVSQNSTYHHMPGKQNRTKFPLSTVRPSASTKLIGTPNESNQIEQNRMLMGSIFRQTIEKVIFRKLLGWRGPGGGAGGWGNWKLAVQKTIRTGDIKWKKIMHFLILSAFWYVSAGAVNYQKGKCWRKKFMRLENSSSPPPP